jgi:hypothetical protein
MEVSSMPGKRVSEEQDQEDEILDDEWEDEIERKKRSDADQPRIWERDIKIFRWIGEQGAASADNLRELAGREAAGPTKEPGLLSKARIRHLIEDRWLPAKMVYEDTMMGRRWIWLTKRALQRVGLPFAPHRPADVNLNHIHHVNRIRLYLERLYWSQELPGSWESERMIERAKKEWKERRRADSGIYIPDQYELWHMPDAIFYYRNTKSQKDDYWAFIEVETSQKRPEKLADIIHNLATHGVTWYFVDTDPKKGVYTGLIDVLATLTGRDERLRARFWLYDLMEPTRLLYHYEKPKQPNT